jgi:hypothetical protein
MSIYKANPPAGGMIILLLIFVNAILLKTAFINNETGWANLIMTFLLLLIALYSLRRNKNTA